MRKVLLSLCALFTVLGGLLLATDGPLTNLMNLRGRTDSNGYLMVYGAALGGGTDGPLTALSNLRGRTDSNGYLEVNCFSGCSSAVTGTDTYVCFYDSTAAVCNDAGFTYNKTTDSATLVGTLLVGNGNGSFDLNGALNANGIQTGPIRATNGAAPTCTGSCGTSPSVAGRDSGMVITMGASGVPASPFTVTFGGTWAAAPSCVAQPALAGMVVGKIPIIVATTTTTAIITTNGTAPATSDKYALICIGVA